MKTPAQELGVRMLTVCYDFENKLGMVISEPANSDTFATVRLLESIDPDVMEIRIIPGGQNFTGTLMRRGTAKLWHIQPYDTREDFAERAVNAD